MDQRTSDRSAGATTEFERDVYLLLLETMNKVAKEEREDVGTESLLSALVSGDSAAGSAIAPGVKASGTLGGSIGARGTSVWISADAGDGATGDPDDEREVDAFWRTVRHEQAKRLRWKNRKKDKKEGAGDGGQERAPVELPPVTGALRSCLRKALEAAREEGTISVRVRHVARALFELPDTRAREAMTVHKLDVPAGSAFDALRAREGREERDEAAEPSPVLVLRKAGTFGKSGNPLTRKFTAWIFGGGAGFGSAVVGVVGSEGRRAAIRRGAPEAEPVDTLLGILALDRALTVAGRELPGKLAEANRGAELLYRYGARQDALTRAVLPTTGVSQEEPPEVPNSAAFERRLLHVTQFVAGARNSPTVGTTHLLAALLDETGTDAESAAEVEQLLSACGVDVAGLREEPELRVPRGAAHGA